MVHMCDEILGKIDFFESNFCGRWFLAPCKLFILFIAFLYDHYWFLRNILIASLVSR